MPKYQLDTHDEHSPLNPVNQSETELEIEIDELEVTKEMVEIQTKRLNYKIWQLSKLAEIEKDFRTFGNITYEQQKEKYEILNQYMK